MLPDNKEAKPNPCPFCGCEYTEIGTDEHGNDFVMCNGCGATGPKTIHEHFAVIAWNMRMP